MISQSATAFIIERASCSRVTFTQPSPVISLRGFHREETGLQEKMKVCDLLA